MFLVPPPAFWLAGWLLLEDLGNSSPSRRSSQQPSTNNLNVAAPRRVFLAPKSFHVKPL